VKGFSIGAVGYLSYDVSCLFLVDYRKHFEGSLSCFSSSDELCLCEFISKCYHVPLGGWILLVLAVVEFAL
jgi:hypothetical protein